MTKPTYLFLSLILLLVGCEPSIPLDDSPDGVLDFQPNIVWLVAEDLSPILPMYGDSTVETPHLSRLAREGITYLNAFSPSGVCAPSRAAIATGMYQNHIGAQHMRTGGNPQYLPPGVVPYEALPPAEVKMHSEHLRRAGYYTTNNSKEDYQFNKPVTAWDESSRQAHWRNRKPGQPFFAIFNYGVTHESQVWSRAEDSLWVNPNLAPPIPPYLPQNEVGQKDVRRVYSNIKIMDSMVGEALAELEAAGLMDSTIIFWYADHGGPLPRQKRLLYDSGMRIPLIVRYPDGYRAGEQEDQLVSFIDFKPTLLSLANLEPPGYVDGQAFLGPYASKTQRAYVHGAADRFDEEYDTIRAVRDKQFKYLLNLKPDQPYYLPVAYREQMAIMQELLRMHEAGTLDPYQAQWFRATKDPEELFDTLNDPHELNNLADLPEYADKLAELREEAQRWMEEIGDQGLVPEPEFLASIWPDGTQPVTASPSIEPTENGVHLTSETTGASIGYQVLLSNEEVTDHWQVYTQPVTLNPGERLVAVAHRIGYKPSNQTTYEGP